MVQAEVGARFAESLAEELKGQLAFSDMRLIDLAPLVQTGAATISRWLRGERALPFAFAYSATCAMGMDVADLLVIAEKRMRAQSTGAITEIAARGPAVTRNLRAQGSLFAESVASELKAQIAERSWTVAAVAEATGHFPAVAGGWLAGRRTIPVHFAYNAASVIGLEVGELGKLATLRMDRFDQPEVDGN
ncbi:MULTISPECIES: hypothetical protein [unclassified Leucobacter]|uniref:hypothetical protein n=1 Tax=unclassified Leucobacter TaxID=2621730 RepID=UPI0030175BE4